MTPGQRAYTVWFRYTYPAAPSTTEYTAWGWQLLPPETRAMWEAIAQAVLAAYVAERHPA